ncbi:MAG: 3'-5' exonuclease [Bacteroidales bacterium]|nr:3'-5' exonuclease [Bacteroidales bacterium]
MALELKRPLLFFDIESTGLDIATECIAELCFYKVFPDGRQPEEKTWRFRPWDYPEDNLSAGHQHRMDPMASKVNHITDEDLKNEKPLISYIDEIAGWLKDCDLGGYNSERYDLPLLVSEFERAKKYCKMRLDGGSEVSDAKKASARHILDTLEGIDLQSAVMVDVQKIVYKILPRTLKAAYALFHEGRDFEDAHSALADTKATYDLLVKIADIWNTPGEHSVEHHLTVEADDLLGKDAASIAEFPLRKRDPETGELTIDKEDFYDIAGKLVRRDGRIYINFGKYKGKTIEELYYLDTKRGFLNWVLERDFLQDTKDKLKALYDECEKKSLSGLQNKFK